MFASISPFLGRITSRLQRASNLRSPFQVPSRREVEGQALFFSEAPFWQSPLGGEEGSRGRRRQILQLTNVIQVCISLNSALGSLSDGHHLSRLLQTPSGAAGVCQGLEKIGSSPKFLFSFVGDIRKARASWQNPCVFKNVPSL